MKPVPIDFGPSGGRVRHRMAWTVLLGAAAVAAALAPAWIQAWDALQAAQQAHQAALARHARQADFGVAQTPLPPAAEQAVERLETPWLQMLASIESAGGRDVTLLSLEPHAASREVRIQAQAKDMPALIAYVRALAAAPDFLSVRLESHQVQLQHARQPVDGMVVARWSPQAQRAGPTVSAGSAP